MIFKPITIAIGRAIGFTLFTFDWDSGGSYNFLGLVYDTEDKCLYVALFFKTFYVELVNE